MSNEAQAVQRTAAGGDAHKSSVKARPRAPSSGRPSPPASFVSETLWPEQVPVREGACETLKPVTAKMPAKLLGAHWHYPKAFCLFPTPCTTSGMFAFGAVAERQCLTCREGPRSLLSV